MSHRHNLTCGIKEVMFEIDKLNITMDLRKDLEQAVTNGLYKLHKDIKKKRGRHERKGWFNNV